MSKLPRPTAFEAFMLGWAIAWLTAGIRLYAHFHADLFLVLFGGMFVAHLIAAYVSMHRRGAIATLRGHPLGA
jgi:hypothetical protein